VRVRTRGGVRWRSLAPACLSADCMDTPSAIHDQASPSPFSGEAEATLCPNCGYNMRAATSDRCSECGLVIDRAALRESGFPWAHRKRIGRVRAFLKTVWYVTIDSKRIRHELARPQDARDARWFRVANAVVLSIALLSIAGIAAAEWGLHPIAVKPVSLWSGSASEPLPGWQQDVAVPWCAGMTLLPAIPLYLTLLAIYLTGVSQPPMRLKKYPPEYQSRARALAKYAAAPLAWLLATGALYAFAYVLRHESKANDQDARLFRGPILAAEFLAGLVAAAALFMSVRRPGEWITRSYHAGVGRFAAGVAEILVRSIVGIIALLGIVPWCVGLIWMILDNPG
jgi:hypothetical protein